MHYTLNDGNVLPAIGFGTYKLTGTNGVRAMVGPLIWVTACWIQPLIMKMKVLWAKQCVKWDPT